MKILKFDNLKCTICGERWGRHYGAWCYSWDSGKIFLPVGIKLTDLCEHCNQTFEDHHKRKFCFDMYHTFKTKLDTLPEELFEI